MCVQYTVYVRANVSKNFKIFKYFRSFVPLSFCSKSNQNSNSPEASTTIPFFISTVIPSECVLQDNKQQSETSSGCLLTQKPFKSTAMSS